MSNHPLNLAVRFVLELAALFAFGYWGWTQHNGILRFLLAAGMPLLAAALWGGFRVPEDHGKGLVAIPGWLRLGGELVFFSLAAFALYAAAQQGAALIFAVIVLLHYAVSYDRVVRLLKP